MATQKVVTADDKSALIQVWAVFLGVLSILACIVRTTAKLYTRKRLNGDDILVIVGTLFSIGQTAAVYVACEYGLGRRFDSIDTPDVYFKSKYAADLLFVLAVASCKLAFANGLRLLTPQKVDAVVLGMEISSVVWGVVGVFVVAFECRLPTPWATAPATRCIDLTGFYTYFSVTNMVTDMAMVALLCWSVQRLRTRRANKTLVVGIFCTGRFLMVPAIIGQIVLSNRAFQTNDLSFGLWQASVAVAAVQFLAVFSVCLPNFKFLLDILESGQVRLDDLRRKGHTTYSSSDRYRSGQTSNTGHGSLGTKRRHTSSQQPEVQSQAVSEVHELVTFPRTEVRSDASSPGDEQQQQQQQQRRHSNLAATTWDRQSQTSQSSQTILIHQAWRVDSQRAADSAHTHPGRG